MSAMLRLLPILCLAAVLPAQEQQAGPHPAGTEPSLEEIQMLRRILELPPEHLSRIRGAIEKMERMPPKVRKDFAERLAKFENATPDERRALSRDMRERGGFGGRVLEHHLRSIPPEQAKLERERVMAMTPEARMEYIRRLADRYPEFSKERRPDMKDPGPKDGKMKRRPQPQGPGPVPPAPVPPQ